jgi:hypothetical protein
MIDDDGCGTIGGMSFWQEKPKYSEKTLTNAISPTTNPM